MFGLQQTEPVRLLRSTVIFYDLVFGVYVPLNVASVFRLSVSVKVVILMINRISHQFGDRQQIEITGRPIPESLLLDVTNIFHWDKVPFGTPFRPSELN